MLEIATELAMTDPDYADMALKFVEHFLWIASSMTHLGGETGMWDEEDGFFYDVLRHPDGRAERLKVRSMVGLLPLCATTTLGQGTLDRLPYFAGHFRWFRSNKPKFVENVVHAHRLGEHEGRLLSIVGPERLTRILSTMLDDREFLSPHGLRAVAASHREQPFETVIGGVACSVDYEPGESTSGLFGGNSNWRGPIWFPVNYLLIEALRRFARYFGPDLTVEHMEGQMTLDEVADELSRRLVSIFLDDDAGRRPVFGDIERFQTDPSLHGMIPFHEYFHGDTGKGLGASHQTGWTGLVADLIARRGTR